MRAVVLGLIASTALAQLADQGKPGTQGPWPVSIVSGGWTPDGGLVGTVTVNQSIGIDGGQAWNVTGSVGASSLEWEEVASFDLAGWFDGGGGGRTITSADRLAIGFPSDGGAFTFDFAPISAPTNLAFRPRDFAGREFIMTGYHTLIYISGTGTVRQVGCTYAYEDAPSLESTLCGAAAVTEGRNLSSSSYGGFGYQSGYRTHNTSYTIPFTGSDGERPPAFVLYFTPSAATATITGFEYAVIKFWRRR